MVPPLGREAGADLGPNLLDRFRKDSWVRPLSLTDEV
jgi:hypothetical protein